MTGRRTVSWTWGAAAWGTALLLFLATPGHSREWPRSAMASAYAAGAGRPWAPRGGVRAPTPEVTAGSATRLEIRLQLARIPQHDTDLGRSEIVLRSQADGAIRLRETLSEAWRCLGYHAATRRYVLASANEHGVKVTLRGLLYLEESEPFFVDSAFAAVRFEAMASLLGPGAEHLALIGTDDAHPEASLFALDIGADHLWRLGEAPAPPPRPAGYRPDPLTAAGDPSAWEAPDRHYLALEPGIWSFRDRHTLQVSYGADTERARAGQRDPRTWDLRAGQPAAARLLARVAWLPSLHEYGGACIRISGEPTVYVDPAGIGDVALEPADLILLTHAHDDHFSPRTMRRLLRPGTVVAGHPECLAVLQREGVVTAADCLPLTAGDTRLVRGVAVTATAAFSPRSAAHPPAAGNLGFLLEFDGARLFCSGDSGSVAGLERLAPVDIAVLNWRPPYQMGNEEMATAARALRAAVVIPVHWLPGERDRVAPVRALLPVGTRLILEERD